MKLLMAWIYSRRSATAIEYALLAGGMALVAVGAIFALGDSIENMLAALGITMDNAAARIN